MLTLPLGLGSLIMGSLYAPTVVTGIHQMYTAIDIGQLAKYGVTYWLPLATAGNVTVAALAVAIKSKKQKTNPLHFQHHSVHSWELQNLQSLV